MCRKCQWKEAVTLDRKSEKVDALTNTIPTQNLYVSLIYLNEHFFWCFKFNFRCGVMLLILNDSKGMELTFGFFQLNYQRSFISCTITSKDTSTHISQFI